MKKSTVLITILACWLPCSYSFSQPIDSSCKEPIPEKEILLKEIGQMFIAPIWGYHLPDPERCKSVTSSSPIEDRAFCEDQYRKDQLTAITEFGVGGVIVRRNENLLREFWDKEKKQARTKAGMEPVDLPTKPDYVDVVGKEEWLKVADKFQELSMKKSGIPLILTADAEPGNGGNFDEQTAMPITVKGDPEWLADCPIKGAWDSRALAKVNSTCTERFAEKISRSLRKIGITLNLAPNVSMPRTYFGADDPYLNDRSFKIGLRSIVHPQYPEMPPGRCEPLPGLNLISDVFVDPRAWALRRDFGDDPDIRILHGNAFMNGTKMGGGIPVLKHFPGSFSEEPLQYMYMVPRMDFLGLFKGKTFRNSTFPVFPPPTERWKTIHRKYVSITEPKYSFEYLKQEDLAPFENADVRDAVMLHHALVPALNEKFGDKANVPLPFAKNVITKYVKEELGYKLVMADDMWVISSFCEKTLTDEQRRSKARIRSRHCWIEPELVDKIHALPPELPDSYFLQFKSIGDMVVEAVRAGVDVFIVSTPGNAKQEALWDSVTSVYDAVLNGKLSYCRVHDAYSRVMELKNKVPSLYPEP
jgi:beta-glucosidase-like glycosyl hydrolase